MTADELVLTDLAQLKALTHPLRLDLIETMNREPERTWSAKELAEALATSQTKLYHHLSLLERHGIVRVAETRVVSNIIEKRYQASARSFRADRALLTATAGGSVGPVVDTILDAARAEIVASVEAGLIDLDDAERRRRMALTMSHARLSPARVRQAMRYIEKLSRLDDERDADGTEYGLVIGFYPRATRETDR